MVPGVATAVLVIKSLLGPNDLIGNRTGARSFRYTAHLPDWTRPDIMRLPRTSGRNGRATGPVRLTSKSEFSVVRRQPGGADTGYHDPGDGGWLAGVRTHQGSSFVGSRRARRGAA